MWRLSKVEVVVAILVSAFLGVSTVQASSNYATEVVSYQAGSNAASGYTDPSAALGEPSRQTAGWPTGNTDVTMFNAPWQPDQLVSIGAGGHLIVKFDHPVVDNPPDVNWGIDLLIFGNAFFTDSNYPNGVAGGIYAEPGKIAVSQDGTNWYEIPNVTADNLFPTQGFTDTSGPYAADGTTLSDFTKPVNPDIDWYGKTYAELLALYDGSGGGTGVDISCTGLEWIQYVKVYQDPGDSHSTEIDAFADVVPEPATLCLLALGSVVLLRRGRVESRKNNTIA